MKRLTGVVAVLLIAVTGCDSTGGEVDPGPGARPPQLVSPGANPTESQLPAKRPGQPWVHGTYVICLDRPGTVKVTDVRFESGNLDVTDWAIRPNPAAEGRLLAGDVPGRFASQNIKSTGTTLTRVCDSQGANTYEVVLQLRAGKTTTQGTNIEVLYTSGGREQTLTLPDRVVMCMRPERPNCA